jgi:hypothetical protein
MSGNKMIPVEESFAEWRKDPDYVKAHNVQGLVRFGDRVT